MTRRPWEDPADIDATIRRLRTGQLAGLELRTTTDTNGDALYTSFKRPGMFSRLPKGAVACRRTGLSMHSTRSYEDVLVIDDVKKKLRNGNLVVVGSVGHQRYLHTMQQRRQAMIEHRDGLLRLAHTIDIGLKHVPDTAHALSERIAEALPTLDRSTIERLADQEPDVLVSIAERLQDIDEPAHVNHLIEALDELAPSNVLQGPGAA